MNINLVAISKKVLNMKFPAQKEILYSRCKPKKLKLLLISDTLRDTGYQRTFLEKTGCKVMLVLLI